ncbi:PREDICTED: mitochondrial inner membrane protein OXA1-like [Camelina sativa]|uniref:Mitochondrial inner membrane protein OXA1-like n=1 Tax=Camelina sativa TaxID=90675 RepID=A0ABM0YFJ2_CAMSA|nr:PREDICTED: mitochondrial inner membrane protein OXA1-like [Camelina sativa]
MSLVRCLSLRSVLRARHHRSSYSCLTHLHQTPREEEEEITPSIRSYHSIIHQSSFINGGSALDLSRTHRSVFQSHPATFSSDRFISTFNSSFTGSADAVIDWLFQSAVSRAFELHNVADVLVSLNHILTLLNSFTFSQWWVFIIVTSLLIRGITIPVMVDLLNCIARFFKSLGSDQGKALDKVSVLSKSPGVMYTMLKKEFFGVKGSVIGQGIQVPVFWFSMGELRQNMVEILMSRLRGKMLSAELIKNGVLSRGRLVVVVGDGIGLEIQMFDLDFSLILKRRQISQSYV